MLQDAKEVAQSILEDFRGAGYYRDENRLAEFIKHSLGNPRSGTTSTEVAHAILDDMEGSAYYRDVTILTQFLEGQFPRPSDNRTS